MFEINTKMQLNKEHILKLITTIDLSTQACNLLKKKLTRESKWKKKEN